MTYEPDKRPTRADARAIDRSAAEFSEALRIALDEAAKEIARGQNGQAEPEEAGHLPPRPVYVEVPSPFERQIVAFLNAMWRLVALFGAACAFVGAGRFAHAQNYPPAVFWPAGIAAACAAYLTINSRLGKQTAAGLVSITAVLGVIGAALWVCAGMPPVSPM